MSKDEDIHKADRLCFNTSSLVPAEDPLPLCKPSFQVLCKTARRDWQSQEGYQSFHYQVSCSAALAQADAYASDTSDCILTEGRRSKTELSQSKTMTVIGIKAF